jgi:hypothetical protein
MGFHFVGILLILKVFMNESLTSARPSSISPRAARKDARRRLESRPVLWHPCGVAVGRIGATERAKPTYEPQS